MAQVAPGLSLSEALPCTQDAHLSEPCSARIAHPNRADVRDYLVGLGRRFQNSTQTILSDDRHMSSVGQDTRARHSQLQTPRHPEISLEKHVEVVEKPTATTVSVAIEEVEGDAIQAEDAGRWANFAEAYRKNYCPRRSPNLVLPTPPTDKEKYSFMKMNRSFLLSCEIFGMMVLAYGSWHFATSSPIYCWFAISVTVIELFLGTVVLITIMGRELNPEAHQRIVDAHPLTGDDLPTLDIFLPICKEPLELIENTWRWISALQYPADKKSIFVLDDGADEAVKSLASRFGFNYICRPDRP